MKSIFDPETHQELIRRISMINENSRPQWGKMTAYQMLKHCSLWEELINGEVKSKRVFLGRLFGKSALKNILKNDRYMGKNLPTVPGFRVSDDGDVLVQRKIWITMVEKHPQFSNTAFVHPFFGKMTKEEVGYLAYKHADHHLRQFSC